MGVIIAVVVVIASIFGAALSQQLADEFKAWTPRFVELLIRCAILRLPEEYHERFDEEWRSHISDTPGHFGKVFVAAGFIIASRKIAAFNVLSRRPHQSQPHPKQRWYAAVTTPYLRIRLRLLERTTWRMLQKRPDQERDIRLRLVEVAELARTVRIARAQDLDARINAFVKAYEKSLKDALQDRSKQGEP